MSNDTPETPDLQEIDVHNNRESRAYAAESTQRVSRASDGGAPPHEATPAGELPERGDQGTAGGNPVAGLEISHAEAEDAAVPDDRPQEVDGPATGHA
ncbi:hypothetical protein SAMN04488544_2748 [Microlunatus sagamiharensis]|uniref:Uncharacterized protein n=1 Tax=Microlunatus sagamiharensis TaxID=546874 RepID=A0A1H2MVD8_9ACTN|nr:hypothetical protein [Microlunatus sagamiharensis]SDU96901.1 hypothetical protein SAMN04488544_2748 [Microlunatus sagamiharensis]